MAPLRAFQPMIADFRMRWPDGSMLHRPLPPPLRPDISTEKIASSAINLS
jgi:hypothetical protein